MSSDQFLKAEQLEFHHHDYDGEWVIIVDRETQKQTKISELHLASAIQRLNLDWTE